MDIIQVCSDLHLEYNDITVDKFKEIVIPSASILVLAGDIGNPYKKIYEDFISYCSENFEYVLLITGNHEYYNNDIDLTNNKITYICNLYNNVKFLNNQAFEYDDILFIGSTLWSYIPPNIDEVYQVNDYHKILNFTPQVCNQLYTNNLNYISEKLQNNKCIIITHHAPSYKCISPEYINDPVNCCFANNLDYLFDHENLVGWIYGHLHHNLKEFNLKYFLYSNCYRALNYENNGCII